MKQWWIHHKENIPILEGNEKAELEDLTGCIPLLLCPLLEFAKEPFRNIQQSFLMHQDLVIVGKNIRRFANEILKNGSIHFEQ